MNKPIIAVLLRGHIRETFKNKILFDFLKELCDLYSVKLYIHTWNVYSTNLSWRKIENIIVNVSILDIRTYLSGLNCEIKSIEIDDDSKITLIGDITGNVFSTLLPKLAWKRMWYGISKMAQIINNSEDPGTLIINTRFDLFNNSCSQDKTDKLIRLIDENLGIELIENKFLYSSDNLIGVDNYYVGSPSAMYKLSNNFHTNLDDINSRYINIYFQEVTVFYENNVLFTETANEKKYENIELYYFQNNKINNIQVNINNVEQSQNHIGMRSEYLTDINGIARGLSFLNNSSMEQNNHNHTKTIYNLVSQTVKDKPILEVKHTKSDWKGFGKKK